MARLELPAGSAQKCIDCGREARYQIVHKEEVVKQEYYCEACC